MTEPAPKDSDRQQAHHGETAAVEAPHPTGQILGRGALTVVESFWYILGCIAFGASYFAKIPAKKALSEYGLVTLTSAEQFWYVLQCICFGAGYLSKVITKKALSEVHAA